MPAKSKQQQKFMGIVRAIQKGDEPASKFSKDAQDAADDMKKKDVEDFASTKHKGLPKKVEQALREKIRTMVEDYVETCGYTQSVDGKKLKTPGGTGEEDRELKESTKMTGARGLVSVPNEYVGKLGRVQYNLMKKLGYTRGGTHLIIADMHWGRNSRHRIKPNDQFSSSIILKSSPEKPFGNKDGRLRKKDVMIVLKELMRQLKANRLRLDKKPVYRPDVNNPMIEFRVKPEQFKESVNENRMYKKGDIVSLLSFDRRQRGKARVKGVTKARPNKFGIKNHYITNKGTFSDMEVEGTFPFKLRFKGNNEKIIMKAMGMTEGFGSDEFLTKTEKKKFEKERLENAEVLGYTLTGTKDLKESINESRDFEKLYKFFSKKDYFGLKRVMKTQLGNYKRALKKGDKGAQKYSEKDVINSVNRMIKNRAKFTYDELKKAIKKKDIKALKSKLRYDQPYSLAIFNQITGKKLPKNTRDIHSFLDNQFMKESVFAVRQDKIKNGERFPKEPNFDYDPEKGKSRIRKVNESMSPSAIKKMRDDFEKTGELPPHLKKLAKDLKIIKKKHKVKNIVVPGLEWMSDMKEQSVNEDTYIGYYKNKKVKINAKSDKEAHKQIISKLKVPKKDYDIASIQNLTKKTKTIGDKLYVDSVNESYTLYHNGRPVTGFYTNAFPITKVVGTSTRSYISFPSKKSIKDDFKRALSDVSKDDRFTKQDVKKLATMFKRMKIRKNESVNEARLDPKQTIQQLGGNRFLYMVGAKNLAVDKPRNELHMKIMRNAKGVSHVVIKLTSLDLYDMKFLSIRAGKIRVKATEKGVYGDQLATFFKKHTGLNTRL